MSDKLSQYQFTIMAIDNLVAISENLMQKIDEKKQRELHQSYMEQYRQIMKAVYKLLNDLPTFEQDVVRAMLVSDML
ncbi:hypothetical protein [Thalassomonas haliotis]|uniref:Uncharacterized protein n=1 Tax=Thalassomonas haliotis TaxID=485448 RepID=A0ABY7VG46_9GAMM|nr:hypothetical protein [Thalassomonas haliotis]WDE12010.1 hypothetical protein H3N35_00510 [Thalassomonas haliotis]